MEIRTRPTSGHGLVAAALALLSLSACNKEQSDGFSYEVRTRVGKTLLEQCPEVARIYEDTTFVITPGVEETDLKMQMSDGFMQTVYVISARTDLPGISMRVTMPAMVGSNWKRQTLTGMAETFSLPRERIVAMTNGDYWDTDAPIKPRGPVRMDGTVWLDHFNYIDTKPQQALGFVGIDNTGKMVIGDTLRYHQVKNTLKECTGCGVILVANGIARKVEWTARDPRTAIGCCPDGTVWMLTCDGRKRFGADGLSYEHMSGIFKALGCTEAGTLDGGGSAQMLIRHPVANVWQIRNRPADGTERAVINAWAVTVDEP